MNFPAFVAALSVMAIPANAQASANSSPLTSALAQTNLSLTSTSYKTPKLQVVITGLQPLQKYEFQYKNAQGRVGQRRVKTNACGEATIAKAATFQSLSLAGQEIPLSTMPFKERNRCRQSKKSVTQLVQPTINPARRN
jgi:hypothetical protein